MKQQIFSAQGTMNTLIWELVHRMHQIAFPVFPPWWISGCVYVCKRGVAKLCRNKEFMFSWQPCEEQFWLLSRSRALHNHIELLFSTRPHTLESLTSARRQNLLALLSIWFPAQDPVRAPWALHSPCLTVHTTRGSWHGALCYSLMWLDVLSYTSCACCVACWPSSLEGSC